MSPEANEGVTLTNARCLYTASSELQIGEFVMTLTVWLDVQHLSQFNRSDSIYT